jgi:hypothetical protein
MKKMMFVLTLALSSSAFAGFAAGGDSGDGPYYVSWCTKDNQVASQTNTGAIQINDDCAAKSQTCKQVEVKRPNIDQIYAVCQ